MELFSEQNSSFMILGFVNRYSEALPRESHCRSGSLHFWIANTCTYAASSLKDFWSMISVLFDCSVIKTKYLQKDIYVMDSILETENFQHMTNCGGEDGLVLIWISFHVHQCFHVQKFMTYLALSENICRCKGDQFISRNYASHVFHFSHILKPCFQFIIPIYW